MSSDSDPEDDQEFEVEAIVNYRKFKGRHQYLIKWQGFPDKDNTWEDIAKGATKAAAAAAKNANGKPAARDLDRSSSTANGNRHRQASQSQSASGKTSEPQADSDDEGSADAVEAFESVVSKELLALDSWEDLVESIHTVEADSQNKSLLRVYVRWKDGMRSAHTSDVTNAKCPQQMIRFYESHLKFD
ncbi:hypothetical protein HK105_207962 [Polyrhizophydium stewartii]|uniref:Chromo domain-containing protein n=1 Tax=Polyrhizophydium stewartii TaxID=2732419 RepID=A0ABR4MZ47_9FUNG|nr:hypothetical protein HK105_007392 [Polyrhizophydium stewartii]